MTEKRHKLEVLVLALILTLLVFLTYGLFFLNFSWWQPAVFPPVEAEELTELLPEEPVYSSAPPGRAELISPFNPAGGLAAPPGYPKLIKSNDGQAEFVTAGDKTQAVIVKSQNTKNKNPPLGRVFISSIFPSTGPSGDLIVIKGSGFSDDNNFVLFGNMNGFDSDGTPKNVWGPFPAETGQISFLTPALDRGGKICVEPEVCDKTEAKDLPDGPYRILVANENGVSNSLTYKLKNNPPATTTELTLVDNRAKIEMIIGERLAINFGEGFEWEVDFGNSKIFSILPEVEPSLERGFQRKYIATRNGLTEIKAVGRPLCRDYSPACLTPDIEFGVTVNVKKAD